MFGSRARSGPPRWRWDSPSRAVRGCLHRAGDRARGRRARRHGLERESGSSSGSPFADASASGSGNATMGASGPTAPAAAPARARVARAAMVEVRPTPRVEHRTQARRARTRVRPGSPATLPPARALRWWPRTHDARALRGVRRETLPGEARVGCEGQDIGPVGAGGNVDMTALDSFCSGTTCSVSILYDQTGNANNLPRRRPRISRPSCTGRPRMA